MRSRLAVLVVCALVALLGPVDRAAAAAVELDALPGPVAYGAPVTLRASLLMDQPGTAVTFYRRGGNGAVTTLGQAASDAGGIATFTTTATSSAGYWAQVGATQSPVRTLEVTRTVALRATKRDRGRVQLTAGAAPATGGAFLLQRLDGVQGWVTERSGVAAAAVAWTLKPPRGTSVWRVLSPAGAEFLQAVSAEVTVKGRKRR